ncbi:MAG: NADH-quinone oxidoreductase subunit C [Bacteriovoracaceae bacterium]
METELLKNEILKLDPAITIRDKVDRLCVNVPLANFRSVMITLKEKSEFQFDFLMSHTSVDWIAENKFELLYLLFSTEHMHQVMVSITVDRANPVAPTVSDIWRAAEFQERECYDFMGILYDNHPDLRRVFLEDDWVGFPLRKDYKDDFMLEIPE